MRRIVIVSLLLLAITLCLPLLMSRPRESPPAEAPTPTPSAEVKPTEAPASPAGRLSDEEILFFCLEDGKSHKVSMAEYLPGVLAGEMPASFEPEALKAQAVAARSFILYRMAHGSPHPGAIICDDASCCMAYRDEQSLRELWGRSYSTYKEKLRNAVLETDGEYLCYEGEAIQAVFHSSSPGYTLDSGAIWAPVPYLISVSSPETEAEVPNFITTVEVAAEDFRKSILDVIPSSQLSGRPETWLGETRRDMTGRVDSVEIGGVKVSGNTLRGLFSLRSTCFDLEYTGEHFLFTVTGYGHGVGMSQYGSNVMAKQGSDYREILAHYYPGTELRTG